MSDPTKTRGVLLNALKSSPTGLTVRSLKEHVPVKLDTVARTLARMQYDNEVHIREWTHGGRPGPSAAVWAAGPGKNAVRNSLKPSRHKRVSAGGMVLRKNSRRGQMLMIQHTHQSVFVGGISPWSQTAPA